MSFEACLQIEGISGETLSEGYDGWIELQDFDLSANQTAPAKSASAGGATSRRACMCDFLARKGANNATAKIHEACSSGTDFKRVVVHVFRAGCPKMNISSCCWRQLLSVHSRLPPAAKEDYFPAKLIALNYGLIQLIYLKLSRVSGQGAGQIAGGWDAINNTIYA